MLSSLDSMKVTGPNLNHVLQPSTLYSSSIFSLSFTKFNSCLKNWSKLKSCASTFYTLFFIYILSVFHKIQFLFKKLVYSSSKLKRSHQLRTIVQFYFCVLLYLCLNVYCVTKFLITFFS